MEVSLVGLQNAGKTSLVAAMSTGEPQMESTIPTVGFNMKKVQHGKAQIKLWDVGGQPRFRSMWERYCRGVSSIVFVVDAADKDKLEQAKKELLDLVEKPGLAGIPLLVLGNKNDLEGALTVDGLIEQLELKSIKGREVACYSVSALNITNIDKTMDWLIKHANGASSAPAASSSTEAAPTQVATTSGGSSSSAAATTASG